VRCGRVRVEGIGDQREHTIDPGAAGARVELRVVATSEALQRRKHRPLVLRRRLGKQILQQQIDAAVDRTIRESLLTLDAQDAQQAFARRWQ
jgi:hypothetical protein